MHPSSPRTGVPTPTGSGRAGGAPALPARLHWGARLTGASRTGRLCGPIFTPHQPHAPPPPQEQPRVPLVEDSQPTLVAPPAPARARRRYHRPLHPHPRPLRARPPASDRNSPTPRPALTTQAMREYDHTLIRVRLLGGLMLQAAFHPQARRQAPKAQAGGAAAFFCRAASAPAPPTEGRSGYRGASRPTQPLAPPSPTAATAASHLRRLSLPS